MVAVAHAPDVASSASMWPSLEAHSDESTSTSMWPSLESNGGADSAHTASQTPNLTLHDAPTRRSTSKGKKLPLSNFLGHVEWNVERNVDGAAALRVNAWRTDSSDNHSTTRSQMRRIFEEQREIANSSMHRRGELTSSAHHRDGAWG